jgi:deoxyribodipyrimidine photolyase-related protein
VLAHSTAPIASIEGFVRQVIGWREYMLMLYMKRGGSLRTRNFFQYTNKMPSGFYTASTGIEPVDCVIKRVLDTGYCHHIERLMVLGSFMLLCEIAPDDVYQWFMEFFIDAYDWVMVPNVYGMSQYADGGSMTTKPYICGSNYILKMSNFKRGEWCTIWDALYWRFVDKHYSLMKGNPRMGMMAVMRDKLAASGVLSEHLRIGNEYLERLY